MYTSKTEPIEAYITSQEKRNSKELTEQHDP